MPFLQLLSGVVRRWMPLLLVPVLLLAVTPGTVPAADTEESSALENDDKVFIRVDDRTMTLGRFRTKLENSVDKTIDRLKKKDRAVPSRGAVRQQLTRRLMGTIVNRMIFESHALASDLTVADSAVDEIIQTKIDEAGSREKYLNNIRDNGRTLTEIRRKHRVRLLVDKYIEQNRPDFDVTDEEVEEAYEKHKDDFDTDDQEKIKRFLRGKILDRKENKARIVLLKKLRDKSTVDVNYSILE